MADNGYKVRCVRCPRMTINGGKICATCIKNPLNPMSVKYLEFQQQKAVKEAKRVILVQIGTIGD